MKHGKFIAIFGTLIIVMFLGWLLFANTQSENSISTPTPQTIYGDEAKVTFPTSSQTVSSPLKITGEARGPWYFEATFPVEIEDSEGRLLGQGYAEAIGEWMTEEFVPFSGTLEFVRPTTANGRLIIKNANPSGILENDKSIIVPVKFNY